MHLVLKTIRSHVGLKKKKRAKMINLRIGRKWNHQIFESDDLVFLD